MTAKEKILNQLHAMLTVKRFGLELIMALVVSLAMSTPAFASLPGGGGNTTTGGSSKGGGGSAKCAILDQGAVTCPSSISGGGCWYKDLSQPSAGPNKDGWVKAPDCSNGIFQEAAQPQVNTYTDPALTPCNSNKCDLVVKYIDPLINVLAAGVGVVVTISIVVGGIQYASSAGDPGKMQAAKRRIINAIIALIGFFLFYAILQWLVPGGLLNG